MEYIEIIIYLRGRASVSTHFCWFIPPNTFKGWGWDWARAEPRSWECHHGGRNPVLEPWSLPSGSAFGGRLSSPCQELNLGTPVWSVGILTAPFPFNMGKHSEIAGNLE